MTAELATLLLAIAVFAFGLALLIGHELLQRLLAILGTILAGVVVVFHLLA
jgi:hypothetical protein